MGLVTLPMAFLTLASIVGGVVLIATGNAAVVLWGILAFAVCVCLAPVLERFVVLIDEAAIRGRAASAHSRSRLAAIASGALPMFVILGWELACFRYLRPPGPPAVWSWLWSYGVATTPWTVFALWVSRFRRTLCSIRAYAGHLAYWLLSALVLFAGMPLAGAATIMLIPAILPFVVGMLLAVADRDALSNVRI